MEHQHRYPVLARPTWRLLAILLMAALLSSCTGCSRGKAGSPARQAAQPGGAAATAGASASASALGYCSISITGAEQASFTVPAEEGDFDTDYWRTAVETRGLIRGMLEQDEVNDVNREDIDYLVEQAMARDPRLVLFMMDCSGERAGLMLVPGRFSRYADVPFRPRAYEIAPAANIEAVTEGAFFVEAYIMRGAGPRHYAPVEPGQLNITTFNELQVAGTFSFAAASADGQRVVMTGKFDYRKPKEEVFD